MKSRVLILRCLAVFFASFVSFYGYSSYAQQQISMQDQAIDTFYAAREGRPFWLEGGKITDDARVLIEIIDQAWTNGLNPNVYNYREIVDLVSRKNNSLNTQEALDLELLLTDAYVKYSRDLSGMRVRAADLGMDAAHWRQRMTTEDVLALLSQNTQDFSEFLLSLEPQSKSYQMLKDEMRAVAASDASREGEDFIKFGGLVKPGQGAKDIPKLRARFGLDSPADETKYTYDKDLVVAVTNFQSEKGLKPDGIIGQKTVDMLNLPRNEKIKRLIVNMERLRWIKNDKPSRFIVVNIPASRLFAVEDGAVKLGMPVVVGRKKRETLSFVANIHGVRFNPTWTVPPTIKKQDILPQLQKDPKYLIDKGMEIYQRVGEDLITIDPTMVDWNALRDGELKSYRMVQKAGDNNPLGRVRVLMPNRHDIYLHDTNHPELFSRSDLAQSSGCVRVKYPEKVANFILQGVDGWSDQKMIDVLKSGKTKDYNAVDKIPIYLVYNTVWIGDKNQIIYGTDIYNYDNKLLKLIEKVDGFKIMAENKN